MSIFKKNMTSFEKEASNWKEALKKAVKIMEENNCVDDTYIEKLISETERLGPYYILSKDLAMAHISPCPAILNNGLSLTYFDEPVSFKDDGEHNVKFLFVLTATDEMSHLNILRSLATMFGNKEFYKEFYYVKTFEQIEELVQKYKF